METPPVCELGEALLHIVGELYADGCITASGGNVSARIPASRQLLITPCQVFKGDLRPHHLVRLDLDGRPLDAEAPAPSSEWRMHCAIYRARPDVGAIVHAHAPQATALGLSGRPFRPISAEAARIGELPQVPFIPPGTPELAVAVVEALGSRSAVLLLHHGLVVAASDLRRAADMVAIIERAAGIILRNSKPSAGRANEAEAHMNPPASSAQSTDLPRPSPSPLSGDTATREIALLYARQS